MQQWLYHWSSVEIARQFGMEESLEEMVRPCGWDEGGEGAEETVVWMATSMEACSWYQDEVEG